MRTLGLTAAAIILICTGIWHLVFRDRQFEEYAGAQIGMPLKQAVFALKGNGWIGPLGLESRNASSDACDPDARFSFVEGRSPDYTLTLRTDRTCMVTKIERRINKLEL